ncbi:hypothetical protein C8R46DRAFT_1206252 [Mycena filopes]|nr:hypothetical protein C8R46DRAFT_1206252 [Mycena filopes]
MSTTVFTNRKLPPVVVPLPVQWMLPTPTDMVINSSDDVPVEFPAHQNMVSLIFPSFQADIQNGRLHLDEPRDIVESLRAFAYCRGSGRRADWTQQPRTSKDLDGIWEVRLHKALKRYRITDARQILKNLLLDDALVQEYPHRLFAVALVCNLPQLRKVAAFCSLRLPECPLQVARVLPVLRHVPASMFQDLYDFHHLCGWAAEQLVEQTLQIAITVYHADCRGYSVEISVPALGVGRRESRILPTAINRLFLAHHDHDARPSRRLAAQLTSTLLGIFMGALCLTAFIGPSAQCCRAFQASTGRLFPLVVSVILRVPKA